MNELIFDENALCPCRILKSDLEQVKKIESIDKPYYSYSTCCQSFHTNIRCAINAEQLMRSRYTAFVLGLTEYIVATTLPAQQSLLDKQAISDWAKSTDWAGLDIIRHIPKVGKHHAQVEFKAFYYHQAEDSNDEDIHAQIHASPKRVSQSHHHELSTFVNVKTKETESGGVSSKWYFLDPTVDMNALKMTQKQPCLCGSREKFKHCCGKFLTL